MIVWDGLGGGDPWPFEIRDRFGWGTEWKGSVAVHSRVIRPSPRSSAALTPHLLILGGAGRGGTQELIVSPPRMEYCAYTIPSALGFVLCAVGWLRR